MKRRNRIALWMLVIPLTWLVAATEAHALTTEPLYSIPGGSQQQDQQGGTPYQAYPSVAVPGAIRSPQLPSVFPGEGKEVYPTPSGQQRYRRFFLPPEKPSDFEMFVSEKVEITETQLEFLKSYPGISFSPSPSVLPPGNVSIPVRIVAPPEKQEMQGKAGGAGNARRRETKPQESQPEAMTGRTPEAEAGYLEGTLDTIAAAFKLLGIRSPYAISTDLKEFGYDLFLQPPSSFAPGDRVPVGPNYVLGPGDEIRITVWGKVEGTWDVVVDREGAITLPTVGVLGVTGLTFAELKTLLQNEISKYYTGFHMSVSLGKLRSIKVYLVGHARYPGAYTVSSLSTLVNALFEGGGPAKAGSLRDIQLKRNGKTIVHFDLYDFLLRGDNSNDVRLMPEDVIFIPPVGPLAAVAGNVNAPGIYELKGEKTVAQLIALAGGLNPIAFHGRIRIERVVDGRRQVVFESNWDQIADKDVPLESGDVVKVFQVVQDKRVVRISGAVHREGEYGYREGMTLKDLVSLAGGLQYYAYQKEAELTRLTITDKGPMTRKIVVDLEKALRGDPSANVPLHENDYLFIRTVPEWKLYNIVYVTGEVRFPGKYTIEKGEKLSSLLERAGGFTDKAYLKGAVFTRRSVQKVQQERIDEMVSRLEKELLVKGVSTVSTAVSPEEARIKEAESKQAKDLIEGLRRIKATGRMVISLEQPEALKNSAYDIELTEGDTLYIPPNPQSVQVLGAVFNQTAFIYDKGKSIDSYVNLAGGYTESADTKHVYVFKADGTAVKPGGGGLFLFGGGSYTSKKELEPGDTIVVPEQLERIAWLREFKDITQIVYQIAVTAGVLIVAF